MATKRPFGQVFKLAGRYYAKWPSGRTLKGRTKYTTKAVGGKAEGRAFLKELQKVQARGALLPALTARSMTVDEGLGKYIDAKVAEGRTEGTILGYRVSHRAIRESGLGGIEVGKVTVDDVLAFMRWRRLNIWKTVNGVGVKIEGGKCSNATIKRDRSLLSACSSGSFVRAT